MFFSSCFAFKLPFVVTLQAPYIKMILKTSILKKLPSNGCEGLSNLPVIYHKHEGRRHGSCQLCPQLRQGNQLKSHFTGLQYTVRHHLTCKSKFVCYLVTCQCCGKQYPWSAKHFMHVRWKKWGPAGFTRPKLSGDSGLYQRYYLVIVLPTRYTLFGLSTLIAQKTPSYATT